MATFRVGKPNVCCILTANQTIASPGGSIEWDSVTHQEGEDILNTSNPIQLILPRAGTWLWITQFARGAVGTSSRLDVFHSSDLGNANALIRHPAGTTQQYGVLSELFFGEEGEVLSVDVASSTGNIPLVGTGYPVCKTTLCRLGPERWT